MCIISLYDMLGDNIMVGCMKFGTILTSPTALIDLMSNGRNLAEILNTPIWRLKVYYLDNSLK